MGVSMVIDIVYWKMIWSAGVKRANTAHRCGSHTAEEAKAFNRRLSQLANERFIAWPRGSLRNRPML